MSESIFDSQFSVTDQLPRLSTFRELGIGRVIHRYLVARQERTAPGKDLRNEPKFREGMKCLGPYIFAFRSF